MSKLRLDLADLAVESFDTRALSSPGRGTLFGHEGTTAHTDCWGLTCPGCGQTQLAFCTADCPSNQIDTCWATCATCYGQNTCDATCNTCANSCDGWRTCVYSCWEPTNQASCDPAACEATLTLCEAGG